LFVLHGPVVPDFSVCGAVRGDVQSACVTGWVLASVKICFASCSLCLPYLVLGLAFPILPRCFSTSVLNLSKVLADSSGRIGLVGNPSVDFLPVFDLLRRPGRLRSLVPGGGFLLTSFAISFLNIQSFCVLKLISIHDWVCTTGQFPQVCFVKNPIPDSIVS
jgi:hypothetical protein